MSSNANNPSNGENSLTFEAAYKRLEELLTALNSDELSLEQALLYYEESEKLISLCNERLNDAERRIEKLIKGRSGEPLTDDQGKARLEPFSPSGK